MVESYPVHQPAGATWADVRSHGERLTHIERLNPVAPGQSLVDGTGMGAVVHTENDIIQTFNVGDVPIPAQFPKPSPVTEDGPDRSDGQV